MVSHRSLAGMFEVPRRQARSMVVEEGGGGDGDVVGFRSQGSRPSGRPLEQPVIGSALNRHDKAPVSCLGKDGPASEMEMMKERFARLLLGEDMSGGGKGVTSALALSNAITNLAASVFGEQCRLEPMPHERKARWRREIDWLLSVSDHIVEFLPSQHTTMDGTAVDVMMTRQRNDLLVNIPALRKLDAMLIGYLDSFRDHNGFWYVKRESDDDNKGYGPRQEDKWWLPKPQVPPEGLPDISRKWLQFQKESVNQVLKAAMAINAQVLSEMEIPDNYMESLPKNGRASLGDSIYRSITDDYFDPEDLLSTLDLSTEHKILDLKNRIEASIFIWKRKMNNKDSKSTWGSVVSLEKRELFEERAATILILLKHRFPGISQSTLDISKIQYNKDVGQSILESYSRILESLAFTIISRIDDVLFADRLTQNPAETNRPYSLSEDPINERLKFLNPSKEMEKLNALEVPTSTTLSDFMGWQSVDEELEVKKKELNNLIDKLRSDTSEDIAANDTPTGKRLSYIEKLGKLGGLKSPTDRR